MTVPGCSEYVNPTGTWEAGQPCDPICQALIDNYSVIEYPVELVYIEYAKIIGADDWYIARIDWELNWWGSYEVFLWDGSQMVMNLEDSPTMHDFDVTGQSVDETGSLLLPLIDGSVVYVIDRTHQGNRFIYFWRLSADSELYPLCQARLSLNLSPNEYDLDWSFTDCNNDGFDDLVLEGTMLINEDPSTTPVRKVYLYEPELQVFLLSQEDSFGLDSWDFMDTGFSEDFIEQ